MLAALLGVPWAESGVGPFCPVYVNEGLTLDIDQADGPFPVQHYCFRVGDAEFDGILARLKARGIAYRSTRTARSTRRSTRSTADASSTGASPMDTYGKP